MENINIRLEELKNINTLLKENKVDLETARQNIQCLNIKLVKNINFIIEKRDKNLFVFGLYFHNEDKEKLVSLTELLFRLQQIDNNYIFEPLDMRIREKETIEKNFLNNRIEIIKSLKSIDETLKTEVKNA